MRTLVLSLLLLSVAFAGCAGEDTGFEPTTDPSDGGDESVDSVDTGDAADTDAAGETAENGTETVENLVPVLSFTADVVNGTAPMLVNFTIDAEDDSETLSWALSIDGTETYTGDVVPAVVNHTFAVGDYEISVVLSDGEHTVQEALSLSVAEGDPNAGLPAPQVFEGTVENMVLGCNGDTTINTPNGEYDGWSFELTPDETRITSWQGEELDDPLVSHEGQTGEVPAGTTSLHICLDEDLFLASTHLGADYTLTLYAPGYVR